MIGNHKKTRLMNALCPLDIIINWSLESLWILLWLCYCYCCVMVMVMVIFSLSKIPVIEMTLWSPVRAQQMLNKWWVDCNFQPNSTNFIIDILESVTSSFVVRSNNRCIGNDIHSVATNLWRFHTRFLFSLWMIEPNNHIELVTSIKLGSLIHTVNRHRIRSFNYCIVWTLGL